jgi:hypothetical protein
MKSKKRTKFMVILFLILWIGPCSVSAINLLIESDHYDRGLNGLIGSVETFKLTSPMMGIGIISFFPFVFFASLYSEQKKHGKFLFKRRTPKKMTEKKRRCVKNIKRNGKNKKKKEEKYSNKIK